MSVTYEAVLDMSEGSILFLSALLAPERRRRGTRKGIRALGTSKRAVLILRWFPDDTRMSQLARDNAVSGSAACDYRGCPWRLGRIVAAALVLLHHENHRTT